MENLVIEDNIKNLRNELNELRANGAEMEDIANLIYKIQEEEKRQNENKRKNQNDSNSC